MSENPLSDFITAIRTDVINSMQAKGRYATGDTVRELTIVDEPYRSTLYAPAYIDALEFGRGPTSEGAIQGNPPMIDRIKAWVAAKGIQANPYAVKKSIDKRGYKGKPGVLTEPLSENNINSRLTPALEALADISVKQFADQLVV